MTRREKFFKTIKREMEGYIPFYFMLSPAQEKHFQETTGSSDYFEYYDMPLRFVPLPPVKRNIDFSKYYEVLPENATFDQWGVASSLGSFEHFAKMYPPMINFEQIEEFIAYPYPDPEKDFDWSNVKSNVDAIKERDLIAYAAPGTLGPTLFEIAWYMRGMEKFMMDMITEPDLVNYHLDRITDIRCVMIEKFAATGVDVIRLGDDVGTQIGMMISPSQYREFLKPRMKKIIDSAKKINPGVLIDYHCDGNIMPIIQDFIDVGMDILNPVQPECLDPAEVKRLYGNKLSFNGTLGTQTTLPFGSPEDVDRVCKERIETVGKGGGLILAPTHIVEPEVPWENVEAFLNAVKTYSKVN